LISTRLGLIGGSKGNGHPYSWSAIINGYDKKKIKNCEYPTIKKYLNKKKFPKDFIKNTKVTHIWTQNINLSKKIASTTYIPNIVKDKNKIIKKVDGILLARDDYKNHYKFSKPFLKAGLPVYIDKPISTNRKDFEKIYKNQKYSGQIFTCSATRFSKDLTLKFSDKRKIGKIKKIIAYCPKDWDKYSIHIIEPVIKILPKSDRPLKFEKLRNYKFENLYIKWKSDIETIFIMKKNNKSKIMIEVFGSKRKKKLYFNDTFYAFKSALQKFICGIKRKSIKSPKNYNLKIVKIIEKGINLNA